MKFFAKDSSVILSVVLLGYAFVYLLKSVSAVMLPLLIGSCVIMFERDKSHKINIISGRARLQDRPLGKLVGKVKHIELTYRRLGS